MARIIPHFMTAELDGDFVVFLIGMRVNKLWKILGLGKVGRLVPVSGERASARGRFLAGAEATEL